ncbi:MsnO8 family LLM class oxidoreductase [Paenibacillus polymyxa]|uniref:Bacterial luciferase family protein n=1 Tax=Paenibacillus polymyxa TaxID=1406 RepID=A0A378XTW0_PAEPO|nr:MsnO8 family LLM class oxidoreductase [Paenibacillus polymyxa]MBE7897869.1 MsnO8 family LLM class oxidoreductase [Paenibacillus polymyxa]MBG9764399.1 luciferase [Paenibacillus polymyxa]MCC3259439.1 MsnO8 family LLM class oxidoreductase [Paenibacillus polymyxa]QPK51751.1 MsnO8 family LLM class oxidoreductase [Paenibacillus polymyxa]QPK56837.1 MsnO8 family LLM class oxidoreductase [Paenibacillus polymyxa]
MQPQSLATNSLNLGVLDMVPLLPGNRPEQAVQWAAKLAKQAEAWGYTRYWTSEHHDMEGLASSSPEVLLSHIGAVTTTIQLGVGAILLPHYSPVKVAEWFHLLAALYPGRVELGLGRAPGGGPHASMALSGNFLQHVTELPQKMEALLALLEGTYEYEQIPVFARPMPEQPPALWMLGTNRKSAEYAAQYSTGYVFGQFMSEQQTEEMLSIYRSSFQPSTRMDKPRTMVAVGAVCASTDELAQQWAAQISLGDPAIRASWLVGTPSVITERLRSLQIKYNNDEFLLVTPIPDYEQRLHSYRLIAEVVNGSLDSK